LQRKWQDRSYNSLLRWARKGGQHGEGASPERLIARSMAQTALMSLVLFFVSFLFLAWLVGVMHETWPFIFETPAVTWPLLWLAAGMGGLLALRLRGAYQVFFAGIFVVAAISYL
ncbi:MAG: hypothetical protein D6E12_16310, partial [Desulfovibrio sp.]